MDTAQRGMGLDWPMALELIKRSVAAAKRRERRGGVLRRRHRPPRPRRRRKSIDDVIRAYEEQVAAIEAVGGRIILMASRALARLARTPDDYAKVYGRILGQVREPVIIHWLGDMFDPALAGYWGTADLDRAMDTAVAVINANAAKVDGVKISLLDKDKEIAMRRRLAPGVRMYTGDDFNYAELIAGDEQGYSDALLGIFDAIAPAAAAALSALAKDDLATFHDIFAPTVPLSRHIFRAPTRFYKTGVVFMAYLNGHQDHFTMVGGQESARSTLAPRRALPPRRPRRPAARPGARGRAHALRDGGARRRGVRLHAVIPGPPRAEPGTHRLRRSRKKRRLFDPAPAQRCSWVPGSRFARPGMTVRA